jgi:hypothetical protein
MKKWYNGTTSLPWNNYKVEMFLIITTEVTISILVKFISEIIINTNDLNWFSSEKFYI